MVDLNSLAGATPQELIAVLIASLAIISVIGLIAYIFLSLAFMAIGRKAKVSSPGLAWIPFVGPAIITYKASKMHWWPWLLLIAFLIPFLNIVAMLIFGVYSIIWMWKTFEKIGKPGWWAIVGLGGIIPILGILFSLAALVLLCIAAWGKK
jgi:hypothetical protein